MRLPRPRFTLRWLMIVVAVSGLMLGGWQMKRRSDRYRGLADQFANRAAFETSMESLARQIGELTAESAKEHAEEAAREAAEEKQWAGLLQRSRDRSRGIDPGIYARRRPSIDLHLPEAPMSDFHAEFSLVESRHADQNLAAAKAYAKRAEHFDGLRKKYERAARHPWLLVEPDPPEPPNVMSITGTTEDPPAPK